MEKVRFSNTGTEAAMLSLKMARAITIKANAKIEGGYHSQYELESTFQPTPAEVGQSNRADDGASQFGTPDLTS